MRKIKFKHIVILFIAVGIYTAASRFSERFDLLAFDHLRKTTLLLSVEEPIDSAISPDGTEVATLHREFMGSGATRDGIEVREVQTGRQVGKVSLPTMLWEWKVQFDVPRSLWYCDGGKYLLAFSAPDTLYFSDAHTLQLRASVDLSTFRLPPEEIEVDCSARSGVVVVAAERYGVNVLNIFDLDKRSAVMDLAGSLQGKYHGEGVAISPDGSKVALVTWKFLERSETRIVELIDTQSKQLLSTLRLGGGLDRSYALAFAGNGAVVIGERECHLMCDSMPHHRKLQLWDFDTGGSVRTMGWPGTESYRFFGASADGSVVFGYSATESYCKSCDCGHGELKIENARFTLWDRSTGRVVVRSRKLKVEEHTCFCFFNPFGSCTERELVPELQLSSNGKAVLSSGAHEIQVFSRP